jgi:hypothetical protein
MLALVSACGSMQIEPAPGEGLDPEQVARAIHEASVVRSAGRRVWCVPFARNLSGVEIRGNAGTWWGQACEAYERGHEPEVGAVLAFSATRKLPMGHVAVVSKVIADREIELDHANWHRSQISLGMTVVDVSEANDWSAVRVESQPGSLGRVYPIDGFISAAERPNAAEPGVVVSTRGQ